MKIKRFEAASMSDALRAVKKEFGDDAVILSAKTVKKTNRLFSGKNKKQFVVTAAIDHTGASASGDFKKTGAAGESVLPKHLFAQIDTAENETGSQGFAPITRTGQRKLKSKFVRLTSEIQKTESHFFESRTTLYQRLVDQGIEAWLAKEWSDQVGQLVTGEDAGDDEERSTLSHVIEAGNLIAPAWHGSPNNPPNNSADKQRKLILVGAAGSGKTTTAAKLAATARLQSQSVTVLSMDNYRVAGAEELKRYARIIGFQFEALSSPEELRDAVQRCQKDHLLIVDTPGIGLKAPSTRDNLKEMLAQIDAPEIHLLLNAGFNNSVMQAMVDYFKPVGVQYLLFTHLDWATDHGLLVNAAVNSGLPVSYLSDSSEIPEGFQKATAERLVDLLFPDAKTTANEDPAVTVVGPSQTKHLKGKFLANRNSDIFHRPACRSVQRINNDNILMFENEMDAMAQSYKPCRMCCSEFIVSRPVKAMALSPQTRGR